ncbi:MAG: DUF4290 domain-containing protein [Bacteroidales bacterium]|nr:DUF4290 domain-containing protein [Bacteroidales bacterium]
MERIGLTYNTEKEQIAISEYGRCIQEMIKKLPEIEDRKQRTEAAKYIISVMVQMNPQVKESSDYEHKLWVHLYIISNFNLDVDCPYDPPRIETQKRKPQHIGYQNNEIKYGHYGQYLIKMIEAASKEENDEVREALALSLASQMKRDYLEWNKSVVNDQVIFDDLKRLSNGRLVIPEESKLESSSEILGKNQPQKQQQQQGKKKKKKVPNLKANMNNPNNPAYKKRMQQLGKL